MRPREASPLWVWLTLGLMALLGLMYLTGVLAIDELLASFRR